MNSDSTGKLDLGHLLRAAGVDPDDVVVIRHTARGLSADNAVAWGESLRDYTRTQGRRHSKLPKVPPRMWLVFLGTTGLLGRFITAYENHGEIESEGTDVQRFFDLTPSDVFSAHKDRLVIEWTADPVNWAKVGEQAENVPVIEIADRAQVPFPGFDSIIVDFETLQEVTVDSRYREWQAALASVRGIYLIADTSTRRLYVGKADGADGFLSRWSEYAKTGHGGNAALRELGNIDLTHRRHFQFSILQVFSPNAPARQIDDAESHYKRVLLTRGESGLNRN
ncbi:GIY-YIG nuclease family protein [Arthrobacter antioxidans]|uniref:GIY-YIG nuclease family protein n=1 Tax=Arthrobacter antioxidans TaxID=2895818 RepID=UPI001FFEC349|nr:GIY-YIG nuclease family protein [Arthrobacter antioxidans]